ncbi:hypothetical protein R1sor_005207 [Riccia sorocarpa]|uniref:Uncharacterized protein n=1 Tax=Riccia sorocarpa TaxID=122646 RepID=A0ABD3HN66_9MARC
MSPCRSIMVRKKIFLTIQLESSLVSGAYTRTPTLAVEVSYSTLNREELNHHLRNTIFSNVKISEDSLLEGVVEFDILGAAGLQEAKQIFDLSTTNYFTTGVNSYARYSWNKEFASRYPPCSTTIQPNSSSPQYNWRGSYKVDLNVEVLKELKTRYMSVEVWHQQFPQATKNMTPLVPSNISGWALPSSRLASWWIVDKVISCDPGSRFFHFSSYKHFEETIL